MTDRLAHITSSLFKAWRWHSQLELKHAGQTIGYMAVSVGHIHGGNETSLFQFYLAFAISIMTCGVSYGRCRAVCFMRSEAALPSELLQLKHSHPIMKPLKMLGCCQMVCHWRGQRGEPAAAETSALPRFRGCCNVCAKATLGRLGTLRHWNLMSLESLFDLPYEWADEDIGAKQNLLLGYRYITICMLDTDRLLLTSFYINYTVCVCHSCQNCSQYVIYCVLGLWCYLPE